MERTEYLPEVLGAVEQYPLVREVPEVKRVGKRRIGFFTGEENHVITLEEGIQYTKNYRKSSKRFGTTPRYFGREIIEKILNQDTCVGIRIYHAKRANSTPTVILTGVQTNNTDVHEGILGQEIQLPASWSPAANQLNSDSWKKVAPVKRARKAFTGKENQFATLAEAAQLTRRYQESIEHGEIKGAYFGSGIFRKILAQETCVGIHMYHAMHDDGSPTFVLVGVDEYGSDLIAGTLGQRCMDCPPWCNVYGPLSK